MPNRAYSKTIVQHSISAAGPWQTVWDEREMRLAGRATYQREQDELTIDDLAMKSKLNSEGLWPTITPLA